MISSTLSKLLCAIICNNHLSLPPIKLELSPVDVDVDTDPLVLGSKVEVVEGTVKSDPFEPVNVDQDGKEEVELVEFELGLELDEGAGGGLDEVRLDSNRGESKGETRARENDMF